MGVRIDIVELGCDVQERTQREAASMQLGMGHTELA
jgi:hypothetical protein